MWSARCKILKSAITKFPTNITVTIDIFENEITGNGFHFQKKKTNKQIHFSNNNGTKCIAKLTDRMRIKLRIKWNKSTDKFNIYNHQPSDKVKDACNKSTRDIWRNDRPIAEMFICALQRKPSYISDVDVILFMYLLRFWKKTLSIISWF